MFLIEKGESIVFGGTTQIFEQMICSPDSHRAL